MISLTRKLTLAFLVVGLTGAALVAAFVSLRTRTEFDRFVRDRFRADTVETLADFYQHNGGWAGVEAVLPRPPIRHRSSAGPAWPPLVVVDEAGTVVLGSRRFGAGQRVAPAQLEPAVPIEVNGRAVGRVLFVRPAGRLGLAAETIFLARVNQAILLGALGATAVALALGVLLARTISRPVRALTAATQAVARGHLGQTVDVGTRDELGELAASFNRMSADLDRASRVRRQMTADIAHDLRTPMTVILGYTEGLVDGKFEGDPQVYASMHEEVLHLKVLIDDLRTLSLADAGELPLQRQVTMPRALLDRAAAAHRPLAAARGVTLTVAAGADAPGIDVDPDRMAQVLGNLIGNALRHTPPGGAITLSAAAADGGVLLRVADSGEGIAAEDLPHVFTRHYRGDRARRHEAGASGLGLAIARSLVMAHGGTINVESNVGAGTTFTIALPAAGAVTPIPAQS